MSQKIEFEKGSGNIYRDLGFENPEEELAKARLASMIYDIIEERGLTRSKLPGFWALTNRGSQPSSTAD